MEDNQADSWTNYSCPEVSKSPADDSSSKDENVPSTNAEVSPYRAPQRPPRVRSKSLRQSSPSPVAQTRKRTSSGVFEIDANEPPPKKPELNRSESKAQAPKTNGQQKDTEKPEEVKDKRKGKKDKKKSEVKELIIIDKFDSKAKSKCVSAFKESDSWD